MAARQQHWRRCCVPPKAKSPQATPTALNTRHQGLEAQGQCTAHTYTARCSFSSRTAPQVLGVLGTVSDRGWTLHTGKRLSGDKSVSGTGQGQCLAMPLKVTAVLQPLRPPAQAVLGSVFMELHLIIKTKK